MTRINCARSVWPVLLTLLSVAANAAEPQRLSFVGCPILQDTNTVPCWVAEHEGETYFLGIQTDSGGWSPPLQGHQALVEAIVTDQPRVCGGIVLTSPGSVFDKRPSGSVAGRELPQPPITSTLRELDNNCRTILPEDPRYNTLEPRRGPGPSNPPPARTPEQRAAAQREAAEREAAAQPKPPFVAKTFELHYEFDSELAGLTIAQLQEAIKYATAISAKSIEIVSYRAGVLLSDGSQMAEFTGIAQKRAKELESVLRMYGVPTGVELTLRWNDELQSGNGVDDWKRRRTELVVSP